MWKTLSLLALAVLCAALVDGALYELTINSFEPIPTTQPGIIDYGTLRLTKKGRNLFVVSGSFAVLQNFGNEILVTWELYAKGDGSYRQKYMTGTDMLCKAMEKDTLLYAQLVEVSNVPPKGTCPFPKGNYTVNDYQVTEDKLPPAFPKGDWLFQIVCSRNGEFLSGYKAYATTK